MIYTKDGQRSFKCVAGDCMLARCGFCHSNRVDMDAYAMGSADKHSTVYYPRAKLALSDSQKVKFGTIVVSQSGGKLYLHDSTGRKFQLPTGAIIVNGRDGKPAFLTYSGDVAPTLVR